MSIEGKTNLHFVLETTLRILAPYGWCLAIGLLIGFLIGILI